MLGLGNVVSPLQQREVSLGMQLPVHHSEWFEHLPDRTRPLRGDPPREPSPNPPGRRGQPRSDRGRIWSWAWVWAGRRRSGALQILAQAHSPATW
jgi:hypothetical protein